MNWISRTRAHSEKLDWAAPKQIACRKISAFLSLILLSTSASSNPMGNEAAIQEWLRCAVDSYKEKRELMTFDRKALNTAWSACSDNRTAVLAATPEEQRDIIGRTLEGVHDSVIAEVVAGENQRPGYGLNREQPVPVGGGWQEGVKRALSYLTQLRAPDGEIPLITRVGSCCAFPTANAIKGKQGRLEVYDLTFNESGKATTVYMNTYDEGELDIVAGLKKAEEAAQQDSETARR